MPDPWLREVYIYCIALKIIDSYMIFIKKIMGDTTWSAVRKSGMASAKQTWSCRNGTLKYNNSNVS